MRSAIPVLIFLLTLGQSSIAQRRNVSMIDGNQMFSYTITRYSPAWEIQSGKPEKSEPHLSDNSKLFQKLEDSNVHNLKNLLYAKGFVPNEVVEMNGRSMEKYLARNRLVMHYRIRYRDHTIFLAHLNNSRSRSVVPFLIQSNRWILDAGFAESDFFNLISKPYFNAYTGSFDGLPICDLAFEEIESKRMIYDYSGRSNAAIVKDLKIVDGRIGGAAKLGQESELTIDLRNETDLADARFSIDFHLNIENSLFNKERKREVLSAMTEKNKTLEIFLDNGNLQILVMDAEMLTVPCETDKWFHIKIMQKGKGLSVKIDGEEIITGTINSTSVLDNTILRMGGRYSFRGLLDEFRISK